MSTEEKKVKKKKGNFFTNLIFSPEEETTQETTQEESAEEASISVTNSGAANPIQSFNIPVTGDGVFDKNFGDSFQKVLDDNNLQGIDYLEFSKAIKQMGGSLNDSMAFQTVFTTLRVGDASLTKQKLASAIDHYINVLKEEEKEFKTEMADNVEREINARRKEAADLNTKNADLVQQIQNINEQISQNQQKALQLNAEAADFEAKIGQTHKNFTVTLAHMISGLETDKVKIEQLIKE